ncbi:MAG: rhomboid family intramembrane serine protease [Phycisphaeraceae bacterium]|nr:rhomboid family intramembrane serine protease [Phycisphaeraceae bacterium]
MGLSDRDYHHAGETGFGHGGLGRGSFGGGGFGSGDAWSMTTILLVANVVVFLLQAILSGSSRGSAISPGYWGHFSIETTLYGGQVWRLLTYQFLHGGFGHLLFNMIALFFFGPLMEQWWGRRRFLIFYLLCGTAGAFFYTALFFVPDLLNATARTPMVGASGSIFGILIGCALCYPNQRVMLLIPPVPMKMRTLALVILGIAFFSIVMGARNAGGEAAHLGGAAMGFLLIRYPQVVRWLADLGPGSLDAAREARDRHREKKEATNQQEVDRILAKVKKEGLGSLTPREKRTLQEATDRARKS